MNYQNKWVPTPSFLYRNYLYKKLSLVLSKKDYFLEVGSGNGEFLKYLAARGYRGELLDYSDDVINRLKKQKDKLKGIAIKKGNILKYSPKKKFDAVFCFEVLEHIGEDVKAIKNISKLLKRGGYFFASVPAHMRQWSLMDETKGHYRRYERQELIEKLENNNLKPIKVLNYGFPFLNIIRKISKKGIGVKVQDKRLARFKRTGMSSLVQEYNPAIGWLVTSPVVLYPLFKITDLFLSFDLGFGYVVLARKK